MKDKKENVKMDARNRKDDTSHETKPDSANCRSETHGAIHNTVSNKDDGGSAPHKRRRPEAAREL